MTTPAIDIAGIPDDQGLIISDALTVESIAARRQRAPRLVAGVAAFTSSDIFKTPTIGKPKAKRWDHLLSVETRSRKPGTLKEAARYLNTPGLISLGSGLPCSEYFPFDHIEVKVPLASQFSGDGVKGSGVIARVGKHDASEGDGIYDLSIALNYGQGTGSAQLLRFVTEHTELVSRPPYADWQCVLSIGNTSALEQALRIFTERGDYIIAEEYTYSSAAETARPLGLNILSVQMDRGGLIPEVMDDILSNWDTTARGARKPHLLYTIPTGQNPTGATQSAERRRAIYRVAQKHDLYILEDDPYYYLQMQPYTGPNAPGAPPPSSNEEFLSTLVPTILSMDIDGRVMRMDSFSKVIAPGTRTGWITASEQIAERFTRHNECSTQNPSGFAQIILYKLLDETWGHAGYLEWLIHLRLEYTRRRDWLLVACEKYLPREVVSWDPPAAGMFHWLEVDWHKHPGAGTKDALAVEEELFLATIEKRVLLSCGSWFRADASRAPDRLFFRVTFAAAAPELMAQAISVFADVVREAFLLT